MERHPLDGASLKLARAREHLKALDNKITGFIKSNPYPTRIDPYPDIGKYEVFVSVKAELPVDAIAVIIGDCAHNLRSALDHIAWRVSEDFSGAKPDDTFTQFPIFKTKDGFNGRGIRRVGRGGPNAQALVRACQPYQQRIPEQHPFWLLQALDNIDKHKTLLVSSSVAEMPPKFSIHNRNTGPGKTNWHFAFTLGPIEDGVKVGTLIAVPPNPKAQVKCPIPFDVIFEEPLAEETDRWTVRDILTRIANEVDRTIGKFRPFYANGTYDDSLVTS